MRLTLDEVAAATGGRRSGPASFVDGIGFDTRTLRPGMLFAALRAERDGHDFVAAAFERGAAAALVEHEPAGLPVGATLVVVADVPAALGALGSLARDRLGPVPVVGITGSTGKTSTKDLTAAALTPLGPVLRSPASWNNEVGVPLTLASARPGAAAAVVEMGARGFGQVAALCRIARPRYGIITNIGLAHAEFFGSRAEVARAKGELLETLPPDGGALLSADDDLTEALARRSPAPVLTVGATPGAGVALSGLRLDGGLRASFVAETPWGRVEVGPLPLRGAHQAGNAGFALGVAGLCGVAMDAAALALLDAAPSPWRMELITSPGGLVVLNDAYNANPASMAAALRNLAALATFGTARYAVLGHMAELGEHSEALHRAAGRLAAEAGVTAVVAVGLAPGDASAAALAVGARRSGVEAVVVDSPAAALAALRSRVAPGDAVLVKASRVAGLERVAQSLASWSPGAAG